MRLVRLLKQLMLRGLRTGWLRYHHTPHRLRLATFLLNLRLLLHQMRCLVEQMVLCGGGRRRRRIFAEHGHHRDPRYLIILIQHGALRVAAAQVVGVRGEEFRGTWKGRAFVLSRARSGVVVFGVRAWNLTGIEPKCGLFFVAERGLGGGRACCTTCWARL